MYSEDFARLWDRVSRFSPVAPLLATSESRLPQGPQLPILGIVSNASSAPMNWVSGRRIRMDPKSDVYAILMACSHLVSSEPGENLARAGPGARYCSHPRRCDEVYPSGVGIENSWSCHATADLDKLALSAREAMVSRDSAERTRRTRCVAKTENGRFRDPPWGF